MLYTVEWYDYHSVRASYIRILFVPVVATISKITKHDGMIIYKRHKASCVLLNDGWICVYIYLLSKVESTGSGST